MIDEQRLSGCGKKKERDYKDKKDLQPEESMEQDPGQARLDDNKASVVSASSMNLNFLEENEEGTETLVGTAEPAEDETSKLTHSSAFMNAAHNLPVSNSPCTIETTTKFFNGVSAHEKFRRCSPSTFFENPARRRVASLPPGS